MRDRLWVKHKIVYETMLKLLHWNFSSSVFGIDIGIFPSKNITISNQHSDKISITSRWHVSAKKQPSSGQSRSYIRYNKSLHSVGCHFIEPYICFALARLWLFYSRNMSPRRNWYFITVLINNCCVFRRKYTYILYYTTGWPL